jgi:hypothetical protein
MTGRPIGIYEGHPGRSFGVLMGKDEKTYRNSQNCHSYFSKTQV